MTNDNLKKRIRARMAVTGENYTTALRADRAEGDARLAAKTAQEAESVTQSAGQPTNN